MNKVLHQQLQLKQGGMLKVRCGHGVRIRAIEGSLWVIQEADVRDRILEAGQSLNIEHDGVALIQALQSSTLALQSVVHPLRAGAAATFSVVGGG